MEQVGWNCVYSKAEGMRVVSDAEKDRLLETGLWFDHPNKVNEAGEHHEKQIRQQPRKGRGNGKHSPEPIGSGA